MASPGRFLILASQPLQFGLDIFRTLGWRLLNQPIPATPDPSHRRRKPAPQFVYRTTGSVPIGAASARITLPGWVRCRAYLQ